MTRQRGVLTVLAMGGERNAIPAHLPSGGLNPAETHTEIVPGMRAVFAESTRQRGVLAVLAT